MGVDEFGHHVFISFSSRDQVKAKLICERLEASGLICWISLRDVDPGSNYQASIVQAIQAAPIMVLVFSDNTNQSQEVHKELALASSFRASVVPVRIGDVKPSGALMYELATRQWIDAFENWDAAMERLVATTRATLKGSEPRSLAPSEIVAPSVMPTTRPASPVVPQVTFSKDQLEAARAALAFFVGPIADVLVRKTSTKVASLAELHDRLATHIQSADGQKAFRQRLRVGS